MAESSRPSPEQLAHYAADFNKSKTLEHFGAQVSFPNGDRCRVELKVKPEQRGGLGTSAVNGGVLAAMFDLAIGCTPALIDPSKRSATMQLSMSFERPVTGALLVAEAVIDSLGKTTLFASAKIMDEHGKVCARCQGVVKVAKVSWQRGGSPAIN